MQRLPWWGDDSFGSFIKPIQEVFAKREHPFMPTFTKRMEVISVVIANRMEQTIPVGFDDGVTYAMMEQIQNSPDYAPGDVTWPSEGGSDVACTRQQLYQHLQALLFTMEHARALILLTPEMICDIHRVLMTNSVNDNGRLLCAGAYRNHSANNGAGYLYVEAPQIDTRMKTLCDDFRDAVTKTNPEIHDMCNIVSKLMLDFLLIHPFENGNGRVARILVNYAFVIMGCPFAIPIHNGHTKNRKHYLRCIVRGRTYLSSYLLECLSKACMNFLDIS
jgi:fido (protein-threonine AMPylation protein)